MVKNFLWNILMLPKNFITFFEILKSDVIYGSELFCPVSIYSLKVTTKTLEKGLKLVHS